MRKINLQIPRLNSLDEVRNVLAQIASDSVERFFTWLRSPYLGGQRLREVGTPSLPDDAATKGYVDTVVEEASLGGASPSSDDLVEGASQLRTVGAIPRVTSNGKLGESAILDDGSTLSSSEPLQIDTGATPADSQFGLSANGAGFLGALAYAADNVKVLFDVAWEGGSLIAKHSSCCVLLKNGDKLNIYGATGQTPGSAASLNLLATIDLATGDVNTTGIYRKGGTAGVTGSITLGVVNSTIQYKDWTGVNQSASVVTSVSLTTNTFSGGIRTT